MATEISIPGGSGTPLHLSISGTSTANYARAFASAVDGAASAGSLTINLLSPGDTPPLLGAGITLNEVLEESVQGGTYTLPSADTLSGGSYTLAMAEAPTTVQGSQDGGDTILAQGGVTFVSGLDHSLVDFIGGNNRYDGTRAGNGAVGDDTVAGGAGHDTIDTSSHALTTVFGGAGGTLIELNDVVHASLPNAIGPGDLAYLGEGHATVVADGLRDQVVAAADGQTIFGGTTLNDGRGALLVSITDGDTPAGPADDVIVGGSLATNVYDGVGGNQIFGGANILDVIGMPHRAGSYADTIVAGTGPTLVFGADGMNVDIAAHSTSGGIFMVAGAGNETLNGANAGSFTFFAQTAAHGGTPTALTVVGGSGPDYFSTGVGKETFVAGSGGGLFALNTVGGGGADIVIYGFNASDFVSLDSNDTSAAVHGTVTGGNYAITLSDDTRVTFIGVTSLAGHII